MSLVLHLRPGRDIPIVRGHPWVMSGAIARVEGNEGEDEADLLTADGTRLGRATHHPRSEIRARLFGTGPEDRLDAAGIEHRLKEALARRAAWSGAGPTEAERLVFSEGDGLPGLIVDRYASTLVAQILTAPWEKRRQELVGILAGLCRPRTIYERSDADARRFEGLEPHSGLMWGDAPAGPVRFREGGYTFLADVEGGHKTGFYLDQRQARSRLAEWVRRLGHPRVLNLFAYSDAFGIVALAAGASQVLAVDSSTSARSLAEAQYALNSGCEPERREYRVADAFEQARLLRQDRATFDLVVVDPPRLVARKDRLQRGLRAYKDINLQVLHLLRPGGLLITFSCSGIVERELFMKVVEGAARDAGRPVRLLESLGLPPDHPRRLGFPESEYLKGLVLGV